MNSGLQVTTPGHAYAIAVGNTGENKMELHFQEGVVPEVGRNGFQNEEVLEALIDRLQFLNQKYPCRENSITITKLEEALMWQQRRTADRVARAVEGKNTD